MKTISIHSYRGGVGKSLLAVNTAVQLAKERKVCLIDFDLRAPSLQTYITTELLKNQADIRYFTEYVLGHVTKDAVVNSTTISESLSCVLSNVEVLQNTKDRSKLTQHGEGRVLAKLFEFIRYIKTQQFDYVIIDVMPGVTYRSLDAILVSDEVILVTRPVKSEIEGLKILIDKCYAKTEDTSFYAVINQIERADDVKYKPSLHDIELVQTNIVNIENVLQNKTLSISTIHKIPRIPFLTERIYVLEEPKHPFNQEIIQFTEKITE